MKFGEETLIIILLLNFLIILAIIFSMKKMGKSTFFHLCIS